MLLFESEVTASKPAKSQLFKNSKVPKLEQVGGDDPAVAASRRRQLTG